jgi:hypothetical protein
MRIRGTLRCDPIGVQNAVGIVTTCIAIAALAVTSSAQTGQSPKRTWCGDSPVNFSHPDYLQTPVGIVIVQLPQGWKVARRETGLFYFTQNDESYQAAHTLMYIHVETLETKLDQAVASDEVSFKARCSSADIKTLPPADLLEHGCARVTQTFECRASPRYVDLATKLAIQGLLMDVVLSADSQADIDKHRKEYDELLRHLTVLIQPRAKNGGDAAYRLANDLPAGSL